jgi:uncharacterized FlaG/YvyC family protein
LSRWKNKMKKYLLKNKMGEVINVTIQLCEKDSIEYFSIIKQIPKKELLKIYKVEKYENRNNN